MKTLTLAIVLTCPGVLLAQPKESPTLAITNVTLIDCTGAKPQLDMTVIVVGNRITEIGKSDRVTIPANAKQIKGEGKYLIPGLWDMHVHLEEQFLPQFVANGVTGVRHMFSRPAFPSLPVRDWRKDIESGRIIGPRIVATSKALDGLNGEGPVIPGSAVLVQTPEEGRKAVADLRANGDDFVKVYPFLKREVYFAILEEAARGPKKLAVSGHVPHAISAAEASDHGQKSFEHCYGIVIGCSKDEDKLRKDLVARIEKGALANDTLDATGAWRTQVKALDGFDAEKAEALFKKLAKNESWQVPTLVTRRSWSSLNDPKFTDDPRKKLLPLKVKIAWSVDRNNPGKYPVLGIELSAKDIEQQKLLFEEHLRLTKLMHAAGVRFLAGTDTPVPYCFPGSGLHDELELFVRAGLTPADAILTATRNPAEYLGRIKELGTIERDKLADLVLLDANPLDDIQNIRKIHAVVQNGRFLPKETLDKLAQGRQP